MPENAFTAEEMMTVAAARALPDGAVCFVGIGLPSEAANLARLTHAPNLVLIYESGTIGSKPDVLPLSIGDGELAETAFTVVSTPEVFRYYLQAGRIDVGFLGAAQLDRFGNINTTVIGSYREPKVRLPGAGGAPEIANCSREVVVIVRQSPRTFVEELDFVTTVGRKEGFSRAQGVTRVVTDLGVLERDGGRELILTRVHPGVTEDEARKATGWRLKTAEEVTETSPPTAAELATLRDLKERTRRAHAARH
ncbi:MAG: CoA-transferase subunit beta [Vicinamibacteria bacterium]